MAEIYTQALKICTWTGPGFELEGDIHSLSGEVKASIVGTETDVERLFTGEYIPIWNTVLEMSCRSYWGRLWMVQEQLLAKSKSFVYLDTCDFRVRDFVIAFNYVMNYIRLLPGDHLKSMPTLGFAGFAVLFMALDKSGQRRPGPLDPLIYGTRAQQKDKRDKVYGLLSLMDPAVRDAMRLITVKHIPSSTKNLRGAWRRRRGNSISYTR